MHPVELIAVDIDGTLLDSRELIPERTAAALRIAEASGIRVVLSTGKDNARAASVCGMLGVGSHLISSNGALLRTAGGLTLRRKVFDRAVIEEILALTASFSVRGSLTLEGCGGVELEKMAVGKQPGVLEEWSQEPLQITFCGTRAQMRLLVQAIAHLHAAGRIALSILHLDDRHCVADIGPAGAAKGKALAFLCAHLKIPQERVAAVGDNFNDCSMLEFATYSFVVANAPEAMKARGWHMVPSNDEDGVAHAIESLLRESIPRFTPA